MGITPVVLYIVNLFRRKRAARVLSFGDAFEAKLLGFERHSVKLLLKFLRAEYVALYSYCVDGCEQIFVKKWRRGSISVVPESLSVYSLNGRCYSEVHDADIPLVIEALICFVVVASEVVGGALLGKNLLSL